MNPYSIDEYRPERFSSEPAPADPRTEPACIGLLPTTLRLPEAEAVIQVFFYDAVKFDDGPVAAGARRYAPASGPHRKIPQEGQRRGGVEARKNW